MLIDTKLKVNPITQIESIEVEHEAEHAEVCCAGCKVDGFIAELTASKDRADNRLGELFAMTLHHFNEEQERAKQPTHKPCF